MRVLITGGLGQIGSHVAELCLSRGDQVLVLDNLATGRNVHLDRHELLEVVIGSIADMKLVEEIFSRFQPDVVLHAAASYKDPSDWLNDTLTNCVGGANIVSCSSKYDVDRFVYLQTSLCYGLSPSENPISLEHPRLPEGSSYAISKTTNELYLELSGLDFVTFRLANVIGPRNLAGPLPIFYKRLSQGQKCFVSESRRDFVYVKDLAEHVILAFDGTGSGAYHFSSGTDVSIKTLYDQVVEVLELTEYPEPSVVPLGPDDTATILLDPARTRQDFGEYRVTPLDEIVSSAVAYYRQHGVEQEFTHLRIES